MKSIDDATPEEWNALNKKKPWVKPLIDQEDQHNNYPSLQEAHAAKYKAIAEAPNESTSFPNYGENIPDNSTKFDSVSKPEHYNNGGMECIEAIEGMLDHDEYIGYLRGNSLKYRWRYRYKGKPIEDLRKAEWYERRLMDYLMRHPSEQLR